MGKKRTNHNNNATAAEATVEEVVAPTPEKTVPETTEETVVDAGATDTSSVGSDHAAANASTADATDLKAKAQRTVEVAVNAAKDVAKATVDQIKTQLGEENTQKVMDYATKAKAEVVEVVDFAKDAVDSATAKARTNVNTKITEAKTKINDAKELASTRMNEAKEKATEKVVEAKGKVAGTVDYVKHVAAEKSEKPLQKASEAAEWLKGDVAVTPLEQTTVDVASFVIASTVSIGNSALGVVGLSTVAAKAVTAVRSRVTNIAKQTKTIQSVHTYAGGFWPYRLVTRVVSSVDGNVKARLAPQASTTATIPTREDVSQQ